MKIAVAVALLCVAAYASAANTCQCSSFFNSHIDENLKIFSAPDVEMSSCDAKQEAECRAQCKDVYNHITGNGNNLHLTSEGNTVAQYSCGKVKANIYGGQTGCYYKMCDRQWIHIVDSKGNTCCREGLQVDC